MNVRISDIYTTDLSINTNDITKPYVRPHESYNKHFFFNIQFASTIVGWDTTWINSP